MIIAGIDVFFYYSYKTKCLGTRELIAALNEEIPSVPKIDDNEIIAASSGSGFFVSKEGHIVTNFHVIENYSLLQIWGSSNYSSHWTNPCYMEIHIITQSAVLLHGSFP